MFYYLHIPLPDHLAQQIELLERQYQGNSRSKPHLTLVPSRALKPEASEAKLLERLRIAQAQLATFEVCYHGLGYFGNFQTVYTKVEPSPALQHCHDILDAIVEPFLETSDSKFSAFSTFDVPHMTIASRLTPESGQRAWEALQSEVFDGGFLCTTVLLLRQTEHHHPWTPIFPMRLKPTRRF